MITDDDMFPSNAHEEQIKEGSEDELYGVGWSLLFSFMGFCFSHVPEIRWKTCLCLLLSMLGNAYYLSTIFLRVYLVDTVLDNITPGHCREALVSWRSEQHFRCCRASLDSAKFHLAGCRLF